MKLVSAALLLLKIVHYLISKAEKKGLIDEGQRRQLARQSEKISESGRLAEQIREDAANKSREDLLREAQQ